MKDAYVEQLVIRKISMLNMMLRVCAIVSGILITYILTILVGLISLVAAFVIIYGVYYLFMMTSIEYEYVLVNGELTIDIIYGKNKRKTAGVFDIRKAEIITKTGSSSAVSYERNEQMKTFDYTSGTEENEVYLLVAAYGASNAKIYIEPSKEMLEAIRTQAPNKFKIA